MNMNVKDNKFFNGVREILDTNAPSLLTAGSLIGIGFTIFFAMRASKEAGRVQEEAEEKLEELEQRKTEEDISEDEVKQERQRIKLDRSMKMIYIYRWSLVAGTAAGVMALLSNFLNGRTIATLGTMLALNKKKLEEGANKVKELVGEDKFKKIQEDIDRDILHDKLKDPRNIVVSKKSVGKGDPEVSDDDYVQYYDTWWGQIYEIPRGYLEDAFAEASRTTFLKWNDWRGMLGLESCGGGYKVGWGPNNRFKAHTGWIDLGENGGMKSIIYDVEPVGLSEKKNKSTHR